MGRYRYGVGDSINNVQFLERGRSADWECDTRKISKHTYLYRYLVYLVEYVDAWDECSKEKEQKDDWATDHMTIT